MVLRLIGKFLSKTCIQPTYNLQKQLTFSYGITAMITLFVTVGVSVWAAIYAGHNVVISKTRHVLEKQIVTSIATTNEYTSDIITERFNTFVNEAAIVVELVRDRISGYPTLRFWEDDLYVPFKIHHDQGGGGSGSSIADDGILLNGTSSTSNKDQRLKREYPLNHAKQFGLLPYDWNITLNLVDDSSRPSTIFKEYLREQLQERVDLFQQLNLVERISTASGSFTFPRSCNIYQTNTSKWDYYPGCSDSDNDDRPDSSSGSGSSSSFSSSSSNPMAYKPPRIDNKTVASITIPLRRKSTDLAVILKAMWESDPGIKSIGIYFFNDGYSATVKYPGEDITSTSNDDSYVSIGCNWMLETINPYTQQKLATQEQVSRCHKSPKEVTNMKYYNPMERPFCRDQAQHPGETRIFGPYLDTKNGDWKITFGQAIFDRM